MIDKKTIENNFIKDFAKYLNIKEIKNVTNLSQVERQELIEKVKNYYNYLVENDIEYGQLALEIINNNGKFGLSANYHFKHQSIFDGFKEEDIPIIREQVMISLAFHDMHMRARENYNSSVEFCEPINNYNKAVFKELSTEYAWGGLALSELVGQETFLELYKNGGGDLDAVKMLLKDYKQSTNYPTARLLDSIVHTWRGYSSGTDIVESYISDNAFAPGKDAVSKGYLAKEYGVSEDRIVEDTSAIQPETPMVPYKHYKILPASQIHSESSSNSKDAFDMTELNQSPSLLSVIINAKLINKIQYNIAPKLISKFNTLKDKFIENIRERYKQKEQEICKETGKTIIEKAILLQKQCDAETNDIKNDLELKIHTIRSQLISSIQSQIANKTAELQAKYDEEIYQMLTIKQAQHDQEFKLKCSQVQAAT